MVNDGEGAPPRSSFATAGFMASAVAVGAIALVGVIVVALVLWPGNAETDEAAPEPAPPDSPPVESPAGEGESVCGLPTSDEDDLIDAPEGTEWTAVGTMQAPSTVEAGPEVTDEDGIRQCYAQSPEGALLTAANVLAMGTDPDLVQPMNEVMLAEGEGREAALAELEEHGMGEQGDMRMQVAGFNIMGFSADHARVDLAVEGSTGMFASMTTDLVWEEGDWRIRLDEQGQPVIPVAQIPDASDYIAWSAEG